MHAMTAPTHEPDPETPEKATRRSYSAAYKLRILERLDKAGPGEIGAILRREGLYSSLVSTWRRQRDGGMLAALSAQKRGRKPEKNPLEKENDQLRRRVAQLEQRLETAELIIDVQKKFSQLLGIPLGTTEPPERS